MRSLAGFEEMSGIEVAILIRAVSNLYGNLATKFNPVVDMSGPRWGILMQLWDNEKTGFKKLTPSDISQYQQVTRNTISSLLGRMEQDGLIQRQVAPQDKRRFNIHLTGKGRMLAEKLLPGFASFQNTLARGLSRFERQELIIVLKKLYISLTAKRLDGKPIKLNTPSIVAVAKEGG